MLAAIGELVVNVVADLVAALFAIFPLWLIGLIVTGLGLLFLYFGFEAIGGTIVVLGILLIVASLVRRNYSGNRKVD